VHRDLEQAHLTLALEGLPQSDPALFSLQVFTNILGGGMSSRLFQEVREKRGLCYSVYAFHWGFSDTGIFGVHAATGQSDIAELVPVIISELQKAGENIIQDELNRARAQYRAGLVMSAESAASRASQIARQLLLFGRPIPKEELVERLSALTIERLTDLSARLFSSKPTVTAVGPVGTLASYEAIRDALPRQNAAARKLAV
jgi:predicted Zn-dependent peptidase